MGGGGVESGRDAFGARVGPSWGHLGHPGPQPGPAGSPVGLGLADDFRELTTRRSKWEGAEFVLGPGREGCWLESL